MTSKRIRLLLIPLALVSIAALLSACGGSTATVKLGKQEVTIPSDLPSLGARMRAVLAQEPMEKWAVNCFVTQYEKLLTPEQEEKLGTESEAEFAEFVQPHLQEINQACETPGRHIMNPHASEAELEQIRSAQAAGLGLVLRGNHAPASEIECVEERFEELPRAKLLASLEGTEPRRQQIYLELGLLCEGK